MKHHVLLALVVLVLRAPAVHGQGETVRETPVQAELRTLLNGIAAAYNAGDIDRLTSYLDDNCIVTWPDGTVNQGVKQVKEYLKRMIQGPHRFIDKSNIELATSGPSVMHTGNTTAIAYGRSLDHYKLSEGAEYDQLTTWTATLVKKDGRWQVASLHLSTSMFDNPVLALVYQRTAWWVGGIAGVVGLVLGLVGGWMAGRRFSASRTPAQSQ
jgi:ketosteroid isomerase-like protein